MTENVRGKSVDAANEEIVQVIAQFKPSPASQSVDAKSLESMGDIAALGGVRASVANFYANSAITGTAGYPTYVEMTTIGTVVQENFPETMALRW